MEQRTDKELHELIMAACRERTHNDMARVAHHMFKNRFVCASAKDNVWYEFKEHRWQASDNGVGLRKLLPTAVWREFMRTSQEQTKKAMSESLSEDSSDEFTEKARKLMKAAKHLRITGFKDCVMDECKELFYHEKFENKLDSNPNLVGFTNGVYDLEVMQFRAGQPTDFVSFCTGIDYIEYGPDHPTVHAINTYFFQVLTSTAVREYVLKFFASILSGTIKEQKFHLFTGAGSNSKSMAIELFEKTLGDYCCKVPVTLLTEKRKASNAAQSELARTKGKRLVCLQEPSEDEKLNVWHMKELSGGDKIVTRGIYKAPVEFKPMFRMVMLCNHLPSVPANDNGTWRRISVVEWDSRFVDAPRGPREFPIDNDLPQKMEQWPPHFMAVLLEYYRKYMADGGNPEPPEVKARTAEYKAKHDDMAAFHLSCIQLDRNGVVALHDMYQAFREWLLDEGIHIRRVPTKLEFDKQMSKELKAKTATRNQEKVFLGYVLATRGEGAGDVIDA